jgi:hypothetical protein
MTLTAYGVRARLGWYLRRLQRYPAHMFRWTPEGFQSASLDPRPPWRKPRLHLLAEWRAADEVPSRRRHV